jgi:hypothetical protein
MKKFEKEDCCSWLSENLKINLLFQKVKFAVDFLQNKKVNRMEEVREIDFIKPAKLFFRILCKIPASHIIRANWLYAIQNICP